MGRGITEECQKLHEKELQTEKAHNQIQQKPQVQQSREHNPPPMAKCGPKPLLIKVQ